MRVAVHEVAAATLLVLAGLFAGWLVLEAVGAPAERVYLQYDIGAVEPSSGPVPDASSALERGLEPTLGASVAPDPVRSDEVVLLPGQALAVWIEAQTTDFDPVFEVVLEDSLEEGAMHLAWTPEPGEYGNAVVSGHRTTYTKPFADLDELAMGDVITVRGDIFMVREVLVVEPTAIWVADPRDGYWLTLTTCHPEGLATERLVVVAELV